MRNLTEERSKLSNTKEPIKSPEILWQPFRVSFTDGILVLFEDLLIAQKEDVIDVF